MDKRRPPQLGNRELTERDYICFECPLPECEPESAECPYWAGVSMLARTQHAYCTPRVLVISGREPVVKESNDANCH